eukprot:4891035-Pyramimonas_sp.AAC.1
MQDARVAYAAWLPCCKGDGCSVVCAAGNASCGSAGLSGHEREGGCVRPRRGTATGVTPAGAHCIIRGTHPPSWCITAGGNR